MLRRIFRIAITLAAIIVAYQAYVLLAVPMLEPPLVIREARHVPDDQREPEEQSITRYQRLLSAYFPPEHWSLARPPKVIESGPVMFVLDDYKRQDDGRVDLTRCALVIFPTPRVDGVEPPRDAIVIEAPQGAKLQFDDQFQPARGKIGQITRGEFPGRITIRSDMHEPGPEDDLRVETTDLEMNTKLLYTTHEVRFRLGPNVGGGRELEIRLLEDDRAPSKTGGLKIAGIDSLELRRDVRLRAFLETDSLLPGDRHKRPDELVASRPTKPPVEVTCAGPFHFDFLRYVASFDQDVELWQVNPDGPSDHLSCQQLDIHFVPRQLPATEHRAAVDPARRQRKDLGRLEPDKIVAQGNPVVVVSPSRGAQARGGRVQLALRQRQVTLDGGGDAMLVYGSNYLRAPVIEYQHPAADAATKIGRFRADGPGTLRYVPDPTKPEQALEASWQRGIELGRYNGQPVLSVAGRLQLAVAGAGRLTADRLQVFLRELEPGGAGGPAVPTLGQQTWGDKLQVVPDRLAAAGKVQIESPQLAAHTEVLRATFRVEPADADTTSQASSDRLTSGVGAARPGESSGQAYQLDADQLHLEMALRGPHVVPLEARCAGQVEFRELPTYSASEGPLEVAGGELVLEDLDSAPHVTILGAAPGEPPGSRPAQIQARGVTLLADQVQLDAGENRMWSDGPGQATLLVTRDLEGRATASAFPLEIHWQDGLNFDGHYVVLDGQVRIQSDDGWLRCDRLSSKLTAPVAFGQSIDGQALDLAEVQCDGRVVMDHWGRDAAGPTSHERVALAQLKINQQTGAISGHGPGSIRSTHYADQLNSLVKPASKEPTPTGLSTVAAPALGHNTGQKLHFFRVDFQSGLVGNLFTRELALQDRVRTVYGPVDAWEQELDTNRPETLLPGAVTLTCDELSVNEDPVAKRRNGATGRAVGPVELLARSNVRIDGESPTQGVFAAQADRATYTQAKEVFILEGTSQVPATLWHRPHNTGQMAQNSARKITYHRDTGEFKIEDIRTFDFTPPAGPPSAPQNARGTAPLRQ